MRVISTTDLSREGNDCYSQESISLVEQFGIYAIIKYLRVPGWPDKEQVEVIFSCDKCGEAVEKYDSLGGRI